MEYELSLKGAWSDHVTCLNFRVNNHIFGRQKLESSKLFIGRLYQVLVFGRQSTTNNVHGQSGY